MRHSKVSLIQHSWFPHIEFLINYLFEAEKRRIKAAMDKMLQRASELYGEKLDGFHYLGEFYQPGNLRGKLNRKVLPHALHNVMDEHLADAAIIKRDEQSIRQVLSFLFEGCVDAQDVRNSLPDCLAKVLDYTKSLDRTREEAFIIRSDERRMRAYLKTLPAMQFYATARLIY